jgi:hypothetical protein
MSKELDTITDVVMGKIREGKIKTRPKIYFILGSLLAFLGLASSIILSVFLIGLLRFLSRSHGPMGEYRLEQILASFPWWAPVLAVLGLISGIWLLKRYDFSYKIDFKYVVVGLVLAVISLAFLLDMSGLNEVWASRGPMRGVMQQYLPSDGAQPGGGQNMHRGRW